MSIEATVRVAKPTENRYEIYVFGGFRTAHYTESELELLDANCLTALSFREEKHSEKGIIEDMGRRAKARRRAARVAAENQTASLDSEETNSEMRDEDETDCEVLSIPSKPSPSKIPILQKGYQVEKSPSPKPEIHVSSSTSPSKIPRPKAQLVYLKPIDVSISSVSTTNPTISSSSAEMISGQTAATMPNEVTPLSFCDLSTEFESKTEPNVDKNQVVVCADANGMELKLDMTAMLAGLDLNFVGLRFL